MGHGLKKPSAVLNRDKLMPPATSDYPDRVSDTTVALAFDKVIPDAGIKEIDVDNEVGLTVHTTCSCACASAATLTTLPGSMIASNPSICIPRKGQLGMVSTSWP